MDKYSELTAKIIGAAMEVHSYWGPGLIDRGISSAKATLSISAFFED
jgi:hypothetical protein